MNLEVVKKSKIEIEIGLNKDNYPIEINWKSSDAPAGYPIQTAKAMLLSFLDKESRDTLKIDLFTNELMVVEMDKLMFDTLRTLANTYYQATNNKELAEQMQHFAHYFGEKTEILKQNK
ncbi:MAG: gliding motility protein GldC [Saprospiraceae bacterium]|nr:gliding motility protein GldC [Saprospiraceae bacterium]